MDSNQSFDALDNPFDWDFRGAKETEMSLGSVLLIILLLMLVGAFPTWPHSRSWGYYPSGTLGLVLVVVLILVLTGRI